MSADKISGLRWTKQDVEAETDQGAEYDVTELLVDDTLNVDAVIKLTPFETLLPE